MLCEEEEFGQQQTAVLNGGTKAKLLWGTTTSSLDKSNVSSSS